MQMKIMTRFKVKQSTACDPIGVVTEEEMIHHPSELESIHPDEQKEKKFSHSDSSTDNFYMDASSVLMSSDSLQFALSSRPSHQHHHSSNYISRRRKTSVGTPLSSPSSPGLHLDDDGAAMKSNWVRRDSSELESCQNNARTVVIGAKTVVSPPTCVSNDNSCSFNHTDNNNNNKNNNNNNNSRNSSSSSSNYKSCTQQMLKPSVASQLFVIMMTMMVTSIWGNKQSRNNNKAKNKSDLQRQRRRHYNQDDHYSVNSNCLRRTFIISVIVFGLCTTTSITSVHGQPPPLPPAGFLDFDNLPVTRFSCEGKVIGGYYADVETGCQMFHVCTLGQKDEIQDIKFLCLNGTVFDQETRVCERVDEVDCSKAEQFFDLNLDLYVPHATTQKPEEPDLEEEDDIIRPVKATSNRPPTRSTTTTTTTRATTTTTTPTPSPRTRPPSSSLASRSRAPVISSSSSSSTSSQQEEDEEDERTRNPYTSFNYYLKTPHSHVASGYNSQSRQSYIINQPGSTSSRGSPRPSSSSAGPLNTGRKVPSGSEPKRIVYTSSSTTSSSTARPKTVVVVKATLPPSKSILKPKTLATPRTTTTTTTPASKYELDDQYDEYYDDEDYPVEAPQAPPPPIQTSKQSAYQQLSYPVSKSTYTPSVRDRFELRDGRSTKGVANAGQTLVSSSTGRTPTGSKISIVSSSAPKASIKPVVAPVKVISSEYYGNNSTEEPYYYDDDYPDDVTLQQQQQDQQPLRTVGGYSSTAASILGKSSRGGVGVSSTAKAPTVRLITSRESLQKLQQQRQQQQQLQQESNKQKEQESRVSADSDYYDDDSEPVNAHDHHFTHVDVPRIPYAKPNVPRVLVTNGKPFLPRLRRQSHYHHYFMPAQFPQRQMHVPGEFMLTSGSSPMRQFYPQQVAAATHRPQRSFFPNFFPFQRRSDSASLSPSEFRQEARARAREWGKDRIDDQTQLWRFQRK